MQGTNFRGCREPWALRQVSQPNSGDVRFPRLSRPFRHRSGTPFDLNILKTCTHFEKNVILVLSCSLHSRFPSRALVIAYILSFNKGSGTLNSGSRPMSRDKGQGRWDFQLWCFRALAASVWFSKSLGTSINSIATPSSIHISFVTHSTVSRVHFRDMME